MAAKKKPYVKMTCAKCKKINYQSHKSKTMEGKLETSKFCNTCRKHTKHKETKK